MKKLKLCALALAVLMAGSAKADEGMWLLQLMKQQHSIDMMKKQGLQLEAEDLYNPDGVSLKDAVGIFGGGCTGEIISPEGLILTNHHCGYAYIQQHSNVNNDYLTKEGEVIRNVNGNQTCHANCTGRGKKGVDEMYLRIISHRYWQHK